MVYAHHTATGPDATSNVFAGPVKKGIIQVNASLTGTIQVIDGATGSTGNVAVITNPTVGQRFEYWGFTSGFRVVPSTTCDLTSSADISRSGA